MRIVKRNFGKTKNGDPVSLFVCHNSHGLVVKMTDLGAREGEDNTSSARECVGPASIPRRSPFRWPPVSRLQTLYASLASRVASAISSS